MNDENNVRFGEFNSEKLAKESQIARDIVKEITQFGVNDRMILLIMHGLAMNFESHETMQAMTSFIRELRNDVFLVDKSEEQELTT